MDRDRRREYAEAEVRKGFGEEEGKEEKSRTTSLGGLSIEVQAEGEPEEESPDENDGGDDDDSDDSEGMASRLDRILEGPPQTGVDVPQTGVPKGGPSGSRES